MTTRLLLPRFWIVATLSFAWFTVAWAASAEGFASQDYARARFAN